MSRFQQQPARRDEDCRPRRAPADRAIALVGLMGAGKSTIGRRLATRLGMPFADADNEIEQAAGCTINEIFERFGEEYFRTGERRVIARLLQGPRLVLATGGGAYMDEATRALMKSDAITIWLRVDIDILVERCSRRDSRPLLKDVDIRQKLLSLMQQRYPFYEMADITVDGGRGPHDLVVEKILHQLEKLGIETKEDGESRQ